MHPYYNEQVGLMIASAIASDPKLVEQMNSGKRPHSEYDVQDVAKEITPFVFTVPTMVDGKEQDVQHQAFCPSAIGGDGWFKGLRDIKSWVNDLVGVVAEIEEVERLAAEEAAKKAAEEAEAARLKAEEEAAQAAAADEKANLEELRDMEARAEVNAETDLVAQELKEIDEMHHGPVG